MTLASTCAMVMAAGLGKRMRPLTDTRPKPLVPVAGKALIDYSLDALATAGVRDAVVNVHYLAHMLEDHLAARDGLPAISVSDERDLLMETGGGMVQARALLADPFFCLNSDNIWTDGAVDTFQALSAAWDADAMDALLLVVPHDRAGNYHGAGDFKLDALASVTDNFSQNRSSRAKSRDWPSEVEASSANGSRLRSNQSLDFARDERVEEGLAGAFGRIARRGSDATAPFIYTGIQIVSHRLLRDAPQGSFSTNLLWERAIGEGRLFGLEHQGKWFEVGEPGAIAPTEAALAGG